MPIRLLQLSLQLLPLAKVLCLLQLPLQIPGVVARGLGVGDLVYGNAPRIMGGTLVWTRYTIFSMRRTSYICVHTR